MTSNRLTRFPALVLAGLALAVPVSAQAPTEPQRIEDGDIVNVEIKIVPFYAVDEHGRPVLDLRQDEIELRVDGKPVPIDSFDAFPQVGGATAIANAGAPEPAAAPVPAPAAAAPAAGSTKRHVVLFFDVAFSNLRGFDSGQKFAEKMVKEAPETDLLYLVTYDFKSGLQQRLGPLAANAKGKKELLAGIKKLKPEAGFLNQGADFGFPLIQRRDPRNGVPASQASALYMAVRNNSDAQLENSAVRLAESFQVLAEQFERLAEPKLMVFLSQGINRRLYWEGSDIAMQFTSNAFANINNKQFRGLHTLYEKPLQQIAETGTLSLFVNLDDKDRGAGEDDNSLEHMARMSGGLYLGDVDPAAANSRAAGSTGAYYEAGFYLTDAALQPTRSKVEVVVRRPGVRTWSAGTIKTRDTWHGLSEDARRLLIVDLVEGDAPAQRARSSVRLDLHNLPGNVLGRSASGKTMLRYEVGWPQELAGRRIDLYNVVIEPTRQAGSPNILRFDKEGTKVDGTARGIDVEVPEKATFVWGIVAVEPATGKTWYRRFHLQGRPGETP